MYIQWLHALDVDIIMAGVCVCVFVNYAMLFVSVLFLIQSIYLLYIIYKRNN